MDFVMDRRERQYLYDLVGDDLDGSGKSDQLS